MKIDIVNELKSKFKFLDKLKNVSRYRLIFLIIFSIKDVINVKLPKGTETVIITLYKNDGFVKAIDEEKLFRETKLSLNVGESLNKKQFSDIILFLDKYHVIECIDGTIQLKEKVFGKDFI